MSKNQEYFEILSDVVEKIYTPRENAFNAARKVMLAGIHLIENGYGNMAILPYIYATGHWRCYLHPIGKPSKPIFRYTSGAGFKYLADHCGGSIRKDVSPEKLANAIMIGVPYELKEMCEGTIAGDYSIWLDELKNRLADGWIPEAFQEFTKDFSVWVIQNVDPDMRHLTMPPPPRYVAPHEEARWNSQPFWRESLESWGKKKELRSLEIDPCAIDGGYPVSHIALELAKALEDAYEHEYEQIFKAAIAALVDSNNQR